ncbi:hypothetical protein [Nocardia sp. CY41]|uniref:hypothetical protein n=1 Tax=Nocardia sp. CY41 TaxID=2608686 RepID=UPI00135B655F|nr:hypothetical protein [Nocardia sp. CY41]
MLDPLAAESLTFTVFRVSRRVDPAQGTNRTKSKPRTVYNRWRPPGAALEFAEHTMTVPGSGKPAQAVDVGTITLLPTSR